LSPKVLATVIPVPYESSLKKHRRDCLINTVSCIVLELFWLFALRSSERAMGMVPQD